MKRDGVCHAPYCRSPSVVILAYLGDRELCEKHKAEHLEEEYRKAIIKINTKWSILPRPAGDSPKACRMSFSVGGEE